MKRTGLTLLAVTLSAVPCLAQYSYRVIDYPAAARTRVFAINNLGQFVGAFWDASGAAHAMFFDGGELKPLDPDGLVGKSPASWAYSLNNRGQIAGRYRDASGAVHGYVFCRGKASTIDFPGASGTEAYGVNDWGDVIGVFYDSSGDSHAFLRRDGVYGQADLSGGVTYPLSINDRREIVGEFVDVPQTVGHGYLERMNGDSRTFDAPGAPSDSTFFISINNRNEILGEYYPAGGYQNFVLAAGRWVPFDLPGEFAPTYVSAQTINDREDVVGWFDDAQGEHGFVALRHQRQGH
jgi:probable HAF family extracellular repeat protein